MDGRRHPSQRRIHLEPSAAESTVHRCVSDGCASIDQGSSTPLLLTLSSHGLHPSIFARAPSASMATSAVPLRRLRPRCDASSCFEPPRSLSVLRLDWSVFPFDRTTKPFRTTNRPVRSIASEAHVDDVDERRGDPRGRTRRVEARGTKDTKQETNEFMISLVGFADGSGRVLAVKDYRGEVSMERVREFCDDVFRTGEAADMPPVVQRGDVNFVFTKSKEVYAFAASRWDINCSLALEFLEQIVEVLKSYSHHNEVKADKIRERLTLVLSILDEAMDFGYPQMLEADILKQYVFEKSIPTDDRKKEKLRERQMRAAAAATGAVPWRKTGLVYRRNEVYLDCVEKVSALLSPSGEILSGEVAGVVKMNCLLSGMPECRIGLNDKLSPDGSTSPGLASPSLQSAMGNRTIGRQVQLDNIRFHQAVRLRNYEEDREICFIPPDGEFDLLHYTQTSHIDTPFRVIPIFTQQGRTRGEYQVTIRAMFPRELSAFKVVLLLPVPSTTAKAAPHTSHGKAKLKLSDGYIRWKIPEMTGEDEYCLSSSVDMVSTVEEKPWEKPPVRMQFQIPMYTASGVRVRFLRVTEQSHYVPQKWVRYMTLAGDYHIRIR